ncbi:MAG TPA: ABC transporter permease [Thermomicrobiales bacterium]|nr:ABC transporter permease [Thermomicrobiales bacterium]
MAVLSPTVDAFEENVEGSGRWKAAWRRFRRNKLATISLVFVALLVLTAVFAPLIAPYAYDDTDYIARRVGIGSEGHLLGTDELGRDVLSRLIYSVRTALVIAIGAEAVALGLAIVVGLLAGYVGGKLDDLLMAVTDIMFVFPSYLLMIIFVTVFGRNELTIFLAIGISSWVGTARLVRAEVLRLKNQEFVEAGKAMGASGATIALRYIMPNAWGPLLVSLSFGIPGAIMAESGLALLGLGVQPPTPSWGSMIQDGLQWVLVSPHLILAPTILFTLTMLAFTWIGDGLRDAFDPQE